MAGRAGGVAIGTSGFARSSYGLGPGDGFGLVSNYNRPANQRQAPPNYFNVSMPSGGVSFGLGSENRGGQKRPAVTGNLDAAFPDYALDPPHKRGRYDPYRDFMGFTSAQANDRPFQGGQGDPVREFGFNMSMLGRSSRTTIGFMTNPTVPGNETILVKQPNYELPGEGDLVIMRNQLPTEQQSMEINNAEDLFIDTTKRVGYTIPGMNHFLASLQRAPDPTATPLSYGAGGSLTYLDFARGEWNSAYDILRHFHIGGIVNSETFVGGTNSVNRTDYGMEHTRRESSDVKVNLVKFGRAQCLNLWKPKMPAGTNLWLILKRVERPSIYRVDTTRAMDQTDFSLITLTQRADNSGERVTTRSQRPWQFVPWASKRGSSRPTDDDLAFEDEFGDIRHGHPIFIGIVNKEDYLSSELSAGELATNLALLRSQQPLDMFFFP